MLRNFKISGSVDLMETAKDIGIKDVFEPSADFSKFSSQPLYVSGIKQDTSVELDEKGCTAAVYTQMMILKIAVVDKGEFHLNRPFAFIIEYNDIPLYVSTVNNPNLK